MKEGLGTLLSSGLQGLEVVETAKRADSRGAVKWHSSTTLLTARTYINGNARIPL